MAESCDRCMGRRVRQWLATGKAPENQHHGDEDRVRDATEASARNLLLPRFSVMPLRQNRIRSGRSHRRTESGEQPVAVGTEKRRPSRRLLNARREFDVTSDGTQRDQEGAVHDAFEVSRERHTHVLEATLLQAGNQPDQK